MTAQETIHVRGEGGGIHEMALPLPEAIKGRLDSGQLTRVNPDGSAYVERPAVKRTPPAKS